MGNNEKLIWQHWLRHAETVPQKEAIVHYTMDEEPFRWTFRELIAEALKVAVFLRKEGVKPGDVCALMIKHNKYFYPVYMGASLLGTVVTVLAYKNPKIHPEKFLDGLKGVSRKSGIDLFLAEEEMNELLSPLVNDSGSTVKNVIFPLNYLDAAELENEVEVLKSELRSSHALTDEHDPFLLQHSSGTTGLQKGVVLSHRAILDHADNYAQALGLSDSDKVVSWLPLYHDMGLIAAFTIPLIKGITSVQIDPFEWVLDPVMLLSAISAEKGTLTWNPNFAYNLMAGKIHRDDLENLDLSCLRMAVNCSEPVKAPSHELFRQRFAPIGLKDECLSACYAMAETTFAVTQTPPGRPAKVLITDKDKLAHGFVHEVTGETAVAVQHCVSSGKPINGCELRIVDSERNDMPENRVGEIMIRSVSLFNGYRNDPEKTAEALDNGWYLSGDLGFCSGGEYYIIGRRKDIIIVAGKNIYPEDVESIVGAVEGVIPGRVVAFGLFDEKLGTDQIHLIAESNAEAHLHPELIRGIMKATRDSELSIAGTYIVPPRWLIKSSSGKLSRSDNKLRICKEKNIPL